MGSSVVLRVPITSTTRTMSTASTTRTTQTSRSTAPTLSTTPVAGPPSTFTPPQCQPTFKKPFIAVIVYPGRLEAAQRQIAATSLLRGKLTGSSGQQFYITRENELLASSPAPIRAYKRPFSYCSDNGTLAFGDSTLWYQCEAQSGVFRYFWKSQPHPSCRQVVLRITVSSDDPDAPKPPVQAHGAHSNSPSAESNSYTGPIVGGVVAGLAVLALFVAFFSFLSRRRRRRRNKRRKEVRRDNPAAELETSEKPQIPEIDSTLPPANLDSEVIHQLHDDVPELPTKIPELDNTEILYTATPGSDSSARSMSE